MLTTLGKGYSTWSNGKGTTMNTMNGSLQLMSMHLMHFESSMTATLTQFGWLEATDLGVYASKMLWMQVLPLFSFNGDH